MSNPIKVAALGFWHVHAAEYAARIQQHPETELVAIWGDDLARGQAAESNDAAFVDDLEELLGRDDIDAVTGDGDDRPSPDHPPRRPSSKAHLYREALGADRHRGRRDH